MCGRQQGPACLCVAPPGVLCGPRWWSGAGTVLEPIADPLALLREVETGSCRQRCFPPPKASCRCSFQAFPAIPSVRRPDHHCLACPFPALAGLRPPRRAQLGCPGTSQVFASPTPSCPRLSGTNWVRPPTSRTPDSGLRLVATVTRRGGEPGQGLQAVLLSPGSCAQVLWWGSQLPVIGYTSRVSEVTMASGNQICTLRVLRPCLYPLRSI